MAGQKIFLSCLVTLILFNLLFYITGYNDSFLSYESILSLFITLGLTAIVIAVLPVIDSESTAKWFLSIVMMASILYRFTVTIPVIDWELPPIGIGLATNLSGMFDADINSLSFMPFIFFTIIGLIGLISGMISMSGGE